MNKLQKLIQETLAGYKKPAKKSCSCGCNTCDTDKAKPMSLNENMAPKEILSEGLKYHIDKKQPLTENVYRAGSEKYFDLWAEARALYSRGILEINNKDDIEILTETHLGHFGILEDGTRVPLDFIMEEITDEEWPEEMLSRHRDMKFILQKSSPDKATYQIVDLENNNKEIGTEIFGSIEDLKYYANNFIKPQGGTRSTYLGEAKDKKKTPALNKPHRGGASGKKYYVYVRNPKTKKIKKVSFGDSTGLSAKINNPEARRAFAKRHDCANKKDRTKASYWSCRLPRYASLLGLKSSFSGFW